MGLNKNDKRPTNISLVEGYDHICNWYSKNIPLLKERTGNRDYVKKSEALIRTTPLSSEISDLEIRGVLGELIYGNLEWANHEMDSQFKMAAYAHSALKAAVLN
jgi:hypothetical protein